jgi:class 3 adenylate cyclase
MPDLPDVDGTTAIAFGAGVAFGLLIAFAFAMLPRSRRRKRQRFNDGRGGPTIEQAVMLGGQAAVKGAIRTAALVREGGVGAALRAPIDGLATWAEVEHPDLRRVAKDGTVNILFSDIQDSTALNEELGDRRWIKVLGAHDKLVRGAVEEQDGHVVKSQGDGFMVAFAEAAEALRCAVKIQRSLDGRRGALKKNPVRVRIGIHSGKAVAKEGDLYGRNVAMAARVAQEAEGGEILVSGALAAQLTEEDGFELGKAREAELKGLGSEEVIEVAWAEPQADA